STILVSVVALAGVAIAAPAETELEARQYISQCNTGSIQCCDSTYSSSSYFVTNLFGLIGLPAPPSSGSSQVGIACSPTTIGGSGSGSSCTQQPVCCAGNSFVSPSCCSLLLARRLRQTRMPVQNWCRQRRLLSHHHQLIFRIRRKCAIVNVRIGSRMFPW
ncbi:hypothetical protein HD554DRAFT_2019724, partial [Boletus coccyginus]